MRRLLVAYLSLTTASNLVHVVYPRRFLVAYLSFTTASNLVYVVYPFISCPFFGFMAPELPFLFVLRTSFERPLFTD